ncbi:uncharacterized protein LOC134819262 [Bolinopsis microptera]|uniref:uncharacterized protein LOC134819262 n=1 Tax=Bolinopsis microptera TaxID=2820187 RepID=UPI00307914D8
MELPILPFSPPNVTVTPHPPLVSLSSFLPPPFLNPFTPPLSLLNNPSFLQYPPHIPVSPLLSPFTPPHSMAPYPQLHSYTHFSPSHSISPFSNPPSASLTPFTSQPSPHHVPAPSPPYSLPRSELIVLSDDDSGRDCALIPERVTPAMRKQLESQRTCQIGCSDPSDSLRTVDLKLTSIVSLAGQQEHWHWNKETSLNPPSEVVDPMTRSLESSSSAPVAGQSSVSRIQVSSVVSLSDNLYSPNRDSKHSAEHGTKLVEPTQPKAFSLSSVNSFFKELEPTIESNPESPSTSNLGSNLEAPSTSNLKSIIEASSISSLKSNLETPLTSNLETSSTPNSDFHQKVESIQPAHFILEPVTLKKTKLTTPAPSDTSIVVILDNNTKKLKEVTEEPLVNLREHFQPTPLLLVNQIISYKQLYESKDLSMQAIRDITTCPLCRVALNKKMKNWTSPKLQMNIIKHMKTVHKVVGIKCISCKKTKVPEHDIPCLCRTCDVCLKSFPSGTCFERHAKSAHIKLVEPDSKDTSFFQCILSNSCNFSCSSNLNFSKHLAEDHHVITYQDENPTNTIVKCPLCSFKSDTVSKLRSHISSFHFASGAGKKFRDRKHKSLSSSIFVFSSSYERGSDVGVLSKDSGPDQEDDVDVG